MTVEKNATLSGWDAADALAEGWSTADVIAWAKSRAEVFKPQRAPTPEPPPAEEPPPHPGPDTEPPPPDHDDDERDRAPFMVLGFDGGTYFYQPRGTQQIVELRARDHRKENLIALASLQYWEINYPAKNGADFTAAANAMMRKSESVGVFKGYENRRGRGAWLDEGRAIFHAGDHLLVDGRRAGFLEVETDYIYEAAKKFAIRDDATASNKDAHELLNICRSFRWESGLSAYLFAGFLVVAPVCGILKWRPHMWVVGAAGSGKSTLLEKVAVPMLGKVGAKVDGGTTEAGIRNSILKSDARPVIFDEFEPNDPSSQQRIKQVINLARVASSGGTRYMGSADQSGRQYTIRSMFLFASINPGVESWADESRITQVALAKNDPKDDEEKQRNLGHYEELLRLIDKVISPEYADAMLMRTIEHLATLRANVETFSNAAASHLGNMRLGDQVGPMLAGCYLLHSAERITFDAALDWIRKRTWDEHTATDAQRDQDKLLQVLMQHRVRFISGNGGQGERSLGELLAASFQSEDSIIPAEAAYETVRRYGVRPDGADGVVISTTHTALKKALEGTPWAMGWRRALMAVDGAKSVKAARFDPGSVTSAVWLPKSAVLGEL